jgi:SAM-dependent methyltransferase
MDVRDLVTGYYGTEGSLAERVLAALAQHGVDLDRLTPADLYPVDQLHAGGAAATGHVLEVLGVGEGTALLDVGCGIGGTSRMAALRGAQVTGVDLTPEFVESATDLTARVGLGDRAGFLVSPGEHLPLEDASLDAAVMVHVGMNVPDKAAVFSEVRRVLRPGGRFAVYDQMATGPVDLTYPLPWADDERSSFVETAEDYQRHLEAAGLSVEAVEDHTAATTGGPPPGPVNQGTLLGPTFLARLGNNVAATQAGLLRAVIVTATA